MSADSLAVRQRRAGASLDRFVTWLFSELAPFPGRSAATLRMVIACLVVVAISMALAVPQAYLSAFFVFFMSKEDMVTTTITGIALVVALIVGFGLAILAFLVTVDHPALRVVLMAVFFCAAMYTSRVFAVGPVAFGVGFVILISQQFVDLYPQPEALVRSTLWSWVAMTFPIVVVLIVNRVVLPARPVVLLRQEAKLRLGFVIEALDRRLAGLSPEAAASFDGKVVGGARPLELLKLSASGDPALKARLPSYEMILDALNRTVEAACMLSAMPPAVDAPADHIRIAALRAAFDDLRLSLDGDLSAFRGSLSPERGLRGDGAPIAAILDEMERHFTEIAGELQQLATVPSGRPRSEARHESRHLFVSDALSNPVYLQFGLKVTFAAMLCYVAYTAFDWPGIHTCVITCAVVALGSVGATIHKATLRLAGALIGAGLATLATVFVVPHLESLGHLLLLIAPVAALAGWITSGSERISYSGVQVAFAFFYGILHGSEPNADVTLVRDRLVGIALGISVMAVVFQYLWPERAEQQMRAALAKAIRAAAALLGRHGHPDAEASSRLIGTERSAVFESLVLAQRVAEVSRFEVSRARRRGSDAELVAAAGATAISALQLVQLRQGTPLERDHAGTDGLKAFDSRVASVLRQMADRLEEGPAGADLVAPAARGRLLEFEEKHLRAVDAGLPGDLATAYRDMVARVNWLAGEQT